MQPELAVPAKKEEKLRNKNTLGQLFCDWLHDKNFENGIKKVVFSLPDYNLVGPDSQQWLENQMAVG